MMSLAYIRGMSKMDTETAAYCARHPKRETALRCASCGTPICPDCMIVTPVGMKCRGCGHNTNSALTNVAPHRFALAFGVSIIAGLGALLLSGIGFFAILLATMYGYFAGGIILKASGMKRGRRLEIVAGVGVILGAVLPKVGPYLIVPLIARHAETALHLSFRGLIDPFFWVVTVITTACVVSKIRYL